MRVMLLSLAIALAPICGVPRLADAGAPPLEDVLRRAGQWVQRFADDSVFVVAEERYEQEYRVRERSSWRVEHRDLVSEIVLVATPEDEARRGYPWVQFRDVVEVDGNPVPDHRGRLEQIFKDVSGSSYSRAQALVEESARFNLGPLVRQINVPSFALFILHPHNQSRFRFASKGEEPIDGTRATVVTYRERERPTMIRSPRREDRPASGSAWIDGATGRVMKTILRVDAGEHWTTETEVTYGRDARLDLWVPLVMHERHQAGADESIDCTARYSNYRRFDTSARMVVPK